MPELTYISDSIHLRSGLTHGAFPPQVEHPVTEMISGLDLVEWQLRVAAGEPLPLTQADLTLAGHSIEARIYAERPAANFFPASGTLLHLRTPAAVGQTTAPPDIRSSAAGVAVRVDTGFVQGDDVSVFYDPMIAKLIVRGPDRVSACRRLYTALGEWQTVGLPTNVPFLRRVLETPEFLAGDVHTNFIPQHARALFPPAAPPRAPLMALAAACWMEEIQVNRQPTGESNVVADMPSPFETLAFQQIGVSVSGGGGGGSGTPLQLQAVDEEGDAAGELMRLHIWREALDQGERVFGWRIAPSAEVESTASKATEGCSWTAESGKISLKDIASGGPGDGFRAVLGDESVRGSVFLKKPLLSDGPAAPVEVHLFTNGGHAHILLSDVATQAAARAESVAAAAAGAVQHPVVSPMPGKLVHVFVSPGQQVKSGAPLVVLEAMKMEHTLYAAADATVKATHAAVGDVVARKALLVSFTEE
mmetsp:Transcript_79714/g.110342  ORF Transcript_79714/g.110342 Transcript_79714/m.110342 type:complete len:476 (+) Transcript_79714:864-2291(+)